MQRALVLAAALLAPAAVRADPPAAYGARRAAEITFRDWRLACLGDDCVVRSAVRAADGAPVLGLEAGRGGLVLSTALPLFLPDGLSLAMGDEPPREVPWRTCDRDGCEALAPLDADLLAGLKRERDVDVTLTLLEGVRVRLPASLLGFTAAWDALAARVPPAPAPPPASPPAPRPADGPGPAVTPP